MQKDQLKEEAGRRQLPTSGTNAELIERIRQWDLDHDDDPLADDPHGDPPSESSSPSASEPAKPQTVFTTRFECPGELSTGVHHENCDRTIHRARQEGLTPRGGAARVGFEFEGDTRYAVYQVNLQRPNAVRRY